MKKNLFTVLLFCVTQLVAQKEFPPSCQQSFDKFGIKNYDVADMMKDAICRVIKNSGDTTYQIMIDQKGDQIRIVSTERTSSFQNKLLFSQDFYKNGQLVSETGINSFFKKSQDFYDFIKKYF